MTTSEKFTVNMDKVFAEKFYMNGTAALNGTLDNSAVSDNGDGTVDIAITGHGLAVGNGIVISGTTNYDGYYVIQTVATNAITIIATYVAETPAGTETYITAFKIPGTIDWRLVSTLLTLSDAGVAASLVVAVDSAKGASWDDPAYESTDLSAVKRSLNDLSGNLEFFLGGDILTFTWANGSSRVWGLTITIQRLY